MSLIQSTAIPSGASAYELEQSLRFDSGGSSYLSFTPSSAGNRKTWTWSGWVKRASLGTIQVLESVNAGSGNSNIFHIYLDGDDDIKISLSNFTIQTVAKYRDTSSWYHIMIVVDTTQATDTNRFKIYVNGTQQTLTTSNTYPSQNDDLAFNQTTEHNIGRREGDADRYTSSYLAELNFIDGQALTPADFGETGDYGEWKPIEYSGSYGTNGFYLPFKQDYTVEGMSTVTYRGTGATQYIGGVGFQPDLVWVKRRDSSAWHILSDSVRGTGKSLYSNDTAAEGDNGSVTLAAFNTDGFTIGSSGAMNTSGASMVGWNWDMGGSNASLTAGSINSTVRANPSYGQSIVSYTGNGTASATVAHGLSAKPEMIIIKNRTSSSKSWYVYHEGLHASSPEDYRVELNATNAASSNTTGNSLQGTAPTSSLFTLGNGSWVNENNSAIIAYCFHSVTGYSKFGSYTGNGSASGPTVTTGFRPAFLMTKQSSTTGDWTLHDSTRDANTILYKELTANSAGAEGTSDADLEFTDTGFVIKRASGQFNTNGATIIYMAFADTREYAYWLDQSGNNNDWTSNNLTESDVMVDSPTNNFATWNPLSVDTAGAATLSEGNLRGVSNNSTNNGHGSTMSAFPNGKTYLEARINVMPSDVYIGISDSSTIFSGLKIYAVAPTYAYRSDGILIYGGGANVPTGINTFGVGDIVQLAIDTTANKLWIGKNNTWQTINNAAQNPSNGTGGYAITADIDYTIVYGGDSGDITINCGQDSSFAGTVTAQGNQDGNDIGDFYYTPPTGFLALCTSNLPDVAVVPSEHFNAVLYTGNATARSITGVGFQPDFVWNKTRSASQNHFLYDAVRGASKDLRSNQTNAEGTSDAVTAFGADGFSVGSGNDGNENNQTYVNWNWKANGSGSSNTNGSINSTVSANVDAGFSIVSWTKEGSSGTKTVGHGLSKAPEIIFFKEVDDPSNWSTYVGVGGSTTRGLLYLNLTAAQTTNDANQWSDTAPTASLFTYNQSYSFGGNNTAEMIGYAFHSVDGYSKVGSYTGNGNADGTFVYTGFRPAWVMWKKTNASGTMWQIMDTARNTFNVMDKYLQANSANAEGDYDFVDYTFIKWI